MTVCSLRKDNLLSRCVYSDILNRKFPPKKLFRPEKFNLCSGAQVKPCRSGLPTGWVTHREYRLKGSYVVLFFLLLFCVLCGVIVNSVSKSRFSIISSSGFRKRKKQRTNMARCSSPENYYSSGRNTELELCRLWSIYRRGNRQINIRNLGFRQCKTIIMPLIPISYSSVSCCRRCLRCARRCSFCSPVSCWPHLLLRCSRWIWSRHSPEDFHFANYRFSFRKLQILISQTTDFHFVSFHFVSLHFVSQTTVSRSLSRPRLQI